jgi:hypothetical protein
MCILNTSVTNPSDRQLVVVANSPQKSEPIKIKWVHSHSQLVRGETESETSNWSAKAYATLYSTIIVQL